MPCLFYRYHQRVVQIMTSFFLRATSIVVTVSVIPSPIYGGGKCTSLIFFLCLCSINTRLYRMPSTVFSPPNNLDFNKAVEDCLSLSSKGDCAILRGPIEDWDVSHITDMEGTFKSAPDFDKDISKWDVSRVTCLNSMFFSATDFDADISRWDVSQVTCMREVFRNAKVFNRNLSKWDVSRVKNMWRLFQDAQLFNGDISKWDVSKVKSMEKLFMGASSFNGNISEWKVSRVTDMSYLFASSNFNGNISKWDVNRVMEMDGMFQNARRFNGDISEWEVSHSANMHNMFYGATSFNRTLCGAWMHIQAQHMSAMFTLSNGSICNLTTSTSSTTSISQVGPKPRAIILITSILGVNAIIAVVVVVIIKRRYKSKSDSRQIGKVALVASAPGMDYCNLDVDQQVEVRISRGISATHQSELVRTYMHLVRAYMHLLLVCDVAKHRRCYTESRDIHHCNRHWPALTYSA